MKLSIETQVGTAVAAAFTVMTAIAIAHEGSVGQAGVPATYGPIKYPRVNTEVTEQGYNSTLQPTLWVDAIRL